MSKILLIDGDMITHRCARSCEPTKEKLEREPLDEGIFRANDLLYRIINTCATNEYRIFISGDRNFRKSLFPDYKANRAKLPRPAYLDPLRELLVREWQAEVCDGYEADDGIGMAHDERSIIVSNDKDFRQITGEIYNPIRDEFEVLDEYESALAFWSQMLKGDASDNVAGIAGLGEVKSKRALVGCSPEEMHAKVYDIYGDSGRFLLNYRLLRILRSTEEYADIERELNEASVSEGKREEPTEARSTEDPTDVPGVDQE
jgi:5'-3' exonuclease